MPSRLTHFLFIFSNRETNFALLTLTALMLILAPKSATAQTTPTFGTATLPDTTYTVSTAVSDTLPVATGGTGTLTYTLNPALPAGLTYTAATAGNGGVIAGTPTTAASATTYTLTVTDANNATTTLTFTLSVALSSDATLSRLTFYTVEQVASGAGGQAGGASGQADSSANLEVQIGDFTYELTSFSFSFTVEAKVTFLTVKPTANDSTATYTITPADDNLEMAGHQVDLDPGDNTITITVTAADRSTIKTYTITVRKKTPIDYDTNDNGLIDVKNLEQLNAIRYDLDGDGQVDRSNDANAYAVAFPDIGPILGKYSMGCKNPCSGYELLNDLDFDTNKDSLITVADSTYFFNIGTKDSTGFVPIAGNNQEFTAIFKGNGHTISNLFIVSYNDYVGLFGTVTGTRIEGVGLINAQVTGYNIGNNSNLGLVGALVGRIKSEIRSGIRSGKIINSYAIGGVVKGKNQVGGLVGAVFSEGQVIASYAATDSVIATSGYAGALVGNNSGTIQASYAIGKVSGSRNGSSQRLVGSGSGTITHSYYDSETTGGSGTHAEAKTTVQLQSPTSYTSTLGNDQTAIYSAWNVNIDSTSITRNSTPDNPWNFGESNQYPVLRYAGHDTTVQFDAQPDKAPNFGTATVRDTTYMANVAVLDTLPAALATSGNGKLTYALTPDLPAGLTYTAATSGNGGVIAGTPTTAASASTYTLTVRDSDANTAASDTDTLAFTLAVTDIVTIPDDSLRAVILNSPEAMVSNGTIKVRDMQRLTRLDAQNKGIKDLTGLEFAINLRVLELGHVKWKNSNSIEYLTPLKGLSKLVGLNLIQTGITDISDLSGLDSLATLDLRGNDISAIDSLANLTNLTYLGLARNPISNISLLSGLTNLRVLNLQSMKNGLSNISPLGNLTSLKNLTLGGNSISNISSLSGLTNLTYLQLWDNRIMDISPLSGLDSLKTLRLNNNRIAVIDSLANLTNLRWLHLDSNSIMDISPLSGLDSLKTLWLNNNRITVIDSLTNLTNLTDLRLHNNHISDLSPLVNNSGLVGSDDQVDVRGNPLSAPSRMSYIPVLQGRGVRVSFDDLTGASLVKVSGDGQIGKAGEALADSFVVKVRSQNNAAYAYRNLPVTFSITAGGGSLSATSDTTDSNGLARTRLTRGATSGGYTVKAFVEGMSDTLIFTTLSRKPVTISDNSLRAVILDSLNMESNDTITVSDMLHLTRLDAPNKGISTLAGLEFAINLDTLDLSNNHIADIDSLARLTHLKKLSLGGNGISDISSLARLTNLTWLWLSYNAISDINSLANLTNLTWLGLGNNRISDISSLSGLTNLTRLGLSNNRIADLEPLVSNRGLGRGDQVDVRGNPLSDDSRTTHIPNLQGKLVTVTFDMLSGLSLVKVSGDGQIGTVGTVLANPFVVKVQDQNMRGYAGLLVAFSVTAGGGSLSTNTDTTDATGQAETTLTLGATARTHTVLVSFRKLSQLQTLTFTATLPTPDFDSNGQVNFADFLALADKIRSGQGAYEVKYDLDGDGIVGMGDFEVFMSRFGDGAFDDAK